MMTNVHISSEAINQPFGYLYTGDYFYYRGDLYIRIVGSDNSYGDAVRLRDGTKTSIPFNEEIDLVTDIEILIK